MALKRSWVETANDPTCEFPLNNLACGVFSTGEDEPRCGVAIGDAILNMHALERARLALPMAGPFFEEPGWNAAMAAGPAVWEALRERLTVLLEDGSEERETVARFLVPMAGARLHLPFAVAEYTDFYAGRHHAFNVGTMFRGAENALPPNWLHIPIGYNGRASTVVVSGADIVRPNGQTMAPDAEMPSFGPSRRLDIELEMGAVVGTPSAMGRPVTVAEADEMIFGYVLLNDWSARDIQAWEYQPLGPFQAKAFATSISPWIVPRAALKPFRRAGPEREVPLLPYLHEPGPMLYDIALEVEMQPAGADRASVISRTNYREMYYSAAQQLAHHASSGCAMRTGDLLGSGTISGPETGSRGSLLELSWGGREPLTLDTGETRSFLEDGDRMTLRGHAQGDGFRVGFGACTGAILPAVEFPG